MGLDLNLLETFVLVAELGSFSAAAAKLGVQRSSVSRSIGTLENDLNLQLFARTTRQLSLTTAGTTFLVRVRPLLASLQQVVQSLPELEESPGGTLRITAPQDIGVTILANAVTGFVARYPAVTVDVSLDSAPTDLVAEGFDIALRAAPGRRKDSSIVSKKLSDIELNLYASPTYLAARGAPKRLDDIRDYELIGFRRLPIAPLRHAMKAAHVTCDDMLFARAACVAGGGVALLPTFTTRDDITSGRLVRLLPKVEQPRGALYLMHAPTAHVPKKVTAFRDYFQEFLAVHPLN